jgi:outer membrane protein OmpA-like peptidoglycan-associated protein
MAIKNYLINRGIPANRLTGKGYGSSKLIVKKRPIRF